MILHVFHLNHLFRQESARKDAQFVQEFSTALDIPVTIRCFDVPRYCKEQGLSAQEGARQVRYSLLEKEAQRLGFSKVALGHQANDQGETILMNLLRGSGLEGLRGMEFRQGIYLRPFLSIFRWEIEDYCQKNHLPYREDPTNRKKIYLRNRLRMELVPYLVDNYNPRFPEALLRMGEILREENRYLEEQTREILPHVIRGVKNDEVILFSPALLDLPLALQRRILRQVYGLLPTSTESLSFQQIEEIRALMDGQGRQISLPRGIRVWKDYDTLVFTRRKEAERSSFCFILPLPGQRQIPGQGRIIKVLEVDKAFFERVKREGPASLSSSHGIYIDGDTVVPPFTVRSRKEGDVFQPLGFGGRKKVKDFFIDEKIPLSQRDAIPIVADAKGMIIWVAGLRMAHGVKITPSTQRILGLFLQE